MGSEGHPQRGWSCPELAICLFLDATLSLMDTGTTFQFHFFNEIIIQLLKSDLLFDYFHPVQLLPPVHNLEGNSSHCRSISLSEGIYYFSFEIGVQKAPQV